MATVKLSHKQLLSFALPLLLLGAVQTFLAHQWHATVGGVAFGAVGLALGLLLLVGGVTAAVGGKGGRAVPLLLPSWAPRALCHYSTWLILLLLVRAASPDPEPAAGAFPPACAKPLGCSRVTLDGAHRAPPGVAPIELATTLQGAVDAVVALVGASPRAHVLSVAEDSDAGGGGGGGVVVHARFVSLLWGFADDVLLRVSCARSGRAVVEAQGQLRVGVGDLGANARRNAALLRALGAAAAAGELPRGTCGRGWLRRPW